MSTSWNDEKQCRNPNGHTAFLFVVCINLMNVTVSSSLHTDLMFLVCWYISSLHGCLSHILQVWHDWITKSVSIAPSRSFVLSIHQLPKHKNWEGGHFIENALKKCGEGNAPCNIKHFWRNFKRGTLIFGELDTVRWIAIKWQLIVWFWGTNKIHLVSSVNVPNCVLNKTQRKFSGCRAWAHLQINECTKIPN